MKKHSKIRLSKHELTDINEHDFFISKKIITQKIYSQLSSLVEETKADKIFDGVDFPEGTDFITGKISKGDNYLGLPFIMLDFPKLFSDERIFAVRTMIWWGKFCSNTLLLSGEPFEMRRFMIQKKISLLEKNDFSICIHESPWHHHFENDNFYPVRKLKKKEFEKIVAVHPFLKISRKIPVKKVNRLIPFSLESFKMFAEMLQS